MGGLKTAMADDRLDQFARNLDWNLLHTFVVVVQEGSITAAANRLLLQQPAVSMALRRLEKTLGHRLIDRRPGYFEMTEAGRKVYLQAREAFGAVVRLPEPYHRHGNGDLWPHQRLHDQQRPQSRLGRHARGVFP